MQNKSIYWHIGRLEAIAIKEFKGDIQAIKEYVDNTAQLREALEAFAEIAAIAKPNCGAKLRALIQQAQVKHSAALAGK